MARDHNRKHGTADLWRAKNIPAGVIENQRKNLTKLRSNGVSIILGSDNFAGNI